MTKYWQIGVPARASFSSRILKVLISKSSWSSTLKTPNCVHTRTISSPVWSCLITKVYTCVYKITYLCKHLFVKKRVFSNSDTWWSYSLIFDTDLKISNQGKTRQVYDLFQDCSKQLENQHDRYMKGDRE